jgi:serine protease Do
MRTSFQFKQSWLLIFAGILVGIVLTAGFGLTLSSHAQEATHSNMTSTPPVYQSPTGDLSAAENLSNVFADVAAEVNPSVVTVFTETDVKAEGMPFSGSPFGEFFGGDDFFKKFFQQPAPEQNYKRMGLGSGVIVDADGILLTNNHVVDDADNIKVRLMDGREFEGTVKGKDPQTDLAVVMIDTKNLTPIKLGNSDKVRVGEMVLAVGSPLNPQLEHTVTSGIISAKGRSGVGLTQYEDYIQTDAAINPGNSGGALVDLRGNLIGINSAIVSQSGGFQGIGFAIPVNLARKVMDDIITNGKVIRGWLGVYIQNITPELAKALDLKSTKGVLVSKVQEDSPAEKAGIKEEDVILAFNGKNLDNASELSTWVAGSSPDQYINLRISRNGEEKKIEVKLGELTEQNQAIAQGKSQFSSIGIQVANIVPELRNQYHLNKDVTGVIVTAVDPNGIAASVGIKAGDVIMKVNRQEIQSVEDFNEQISKVKAGENLLVFLRRGTANLFVAFAKPAK